MVEAVAVAAVLVVRAEETAEPSREVVPGGGGTGYANGAVGYTVSGVTISASAGGGARSNMVAGHRSYKARQTGSRRTPDHGGMPRFVVG